MRKKIALVMAALVCLLLAACNVTVSVNGMSPEEYYLSTEYPDYTIVKTTAVADIEAFLLKGAEDYKTVFFKDGKYQGGTSNIKSPNVGMFVFWDDYGHLALVGGENPDSVHSSYTLTFYDTPEFAGDMLTSRQQDTDKCSQTLITRDVSRQEYILDIYLLPRYYFLDIEGSHWDDGSLL